MKRKAVLLCFIYVFHIGVFAQCCDHLYDISKEEYQNIVVNVLSSLFNCPQISVINSCYSNDTCYFHTFSPTLDSLIQLHNPKLIIKNYFQEENTWFCDDLMLDNPSSSGKFEKTTLTMSFYTESKELLIGITLTLDNDDWIVRDFNIYSVRERY